MPIGWGHTSGGDPRASNQRACVVGKHQGWPRHLDPNTRTALLCRGLTDRKASLWSSWAITGPETVSLGGDGGMGRHFAELRQAGPDLSMLEVGLLSTLA